MKITFKGSFYRDVYYYRVVGYWPRFTLEIKDVPDVCNEPAHFRRLFPLPDDDDYSDLSDWTPFAVQDLLNGRLGDDDIYILSFGFVLEELPNGKYSLRIGDNEICIVEFAGGVPPANLTDLIREAASGDDFDLHEAAGRFFGTEF